MWVDPNSWLSPAFILFYQSALTGALFAGIAYVLRLLTYQIQQETWRSVFGRKTSLDEEVKQVWGTESPKEWVPSVPPKPSMDAATEAAR
jgi:hypothetical protein